MILWVSKVPLEMDLDTNESNECNFLCTFCGHLLKINMRQAMECASRDVSLTELKGTAFSAISFEREYK